MATDAAGGAPADPPVLQVDHFSLWYGPTHALKDVTMTFALTPISRLTPFCTFVVAQD